MPPVVDLIAGARPNFMKLAPVHRSLLARGTVRCRIVHTGQHYDPLMDSALLTELAIPTPHAHLGVARGAPELQTGRMMRAYESQLLQMPADATVVFGDVNGTLACALAAARTGTPVVHVEAGLRSFDSRMPEETNRVATDAISDLLLVSEPSGVTNLRNEGIPDSKIRLVGNVMIDSVRRHLDAANGKRVARRLGIGSQYGIVTLHRPSNVDAPETLERLFRVFDEISARIPLVFPIHPRTRSAAEAAGLGEFARHESNCRVVEPLSYEDILSLLSGATVVLTDSGGIQEETSWLDVPCLTLRENTERPITTELGTNRLVGSDPRRILGAVNDVLAGRWPRGKTIPLWDGHAADRVAKEIGVWMENCRRVAP